MLVPPVLLSVIETITKMATLLGPTITKVASSVIKIVGENLPKFTKLVESMSLISNILKPNEKAADLGAKAIIAEKTAEDFEQINDYIDYLKNDVEDAEPTLNEGADDITSCQAIGIAILLKCIGSELGCDISLPFVHKLCELDIEPNVILTLSKIYSESKVNPEQVSDYIEGSLTLDEANKHSECLLAAYQTAYPLMTKQEAEQAVMKDF